MITMTDFGIIGLNKKRLHQVQLKLRKIIALTEKYKLSLRVEKLKQSFLKIQAEQGTIRNIMKVGS